MPRETRCAALTGHPRGPEVDSGNADGVPARLSSSVIEQLESPQRTSPWRQRFKWTVYALLFVNFSLYLVQDIESARYTLDARSDLLEVLAAYVTSIDLIAWFALILLFELETYVLAGRGWTGANKWAVHGVRLLCYVAILHTSFSYDIALREFQHPERLPAAADVCGYTEGWSFLKNRDYIEIDAGNCAVIGDGPEFFALSDDAVVTDRAGLEEGLILAWTDLIESVSWLLIVFATEVAVWLKQAASGNGALPLAIERMKIALYCLILAIALYWGSKGQILYLWDELVWVLGFRFIDWNIRDWQGWRQRLSVSPSAA